MTPSQLLTAGRAPPAGTLLPIAEREPPVAKWSSSKQTRARRYVPLALLATGSIVVLPGLLAALVVPEKGLVGMAASAASAMVVSLALASVEAWSWKRWRGSRDMLFADLMLWNCVRRLWTERRVGDLRDSYEAAVRTGSPVRIELLEGLSKLLAARSAHTHGHGQRVARYAERIARSLKLPEAEVARIRTAAVVHDLGKIYTPTEILDKPGRLTDEEFEVVKRHSADGADLLGPVRDPELAAIVRHHHERLDGSGYPDCLAGEEIPLGARIVAVADTFDALTSSRPYRAALSHEKALEILTAEAGSKLDSGAVAAFTEGLTPRRRSVASMSFLAAASARALGAVGIASGGLSASGASVAQLVPALGAAGLLALSPGIHEQANVVTVRHHSGRQTRAHAGALSAGSQRAGARSSRQTSPTRSSSGIHSKPAPAAFAPPSATGPGHRQRASAPSRHARARLTDPSSATTGSSAPTGASSTHAATGPSSPTQAQPPPPTTTTTQEPPSHLPEETTTVPTKPPVSVPEVSVPEVKAPEVSVSGVKASVGSNGVSASVKL